MPSAEPSPRSVSDYLSVIRRRLPLTVVVALATVVAAALWTFHQPPLYRASMKIVVGQKGGVFDPRLGNVAEQFTQTMSDLLQSQIVAGTVVRELGLASTSQDVLNHLTVVTKPATAVLLVTYDDGDQARAVRVLSAMGSVFTGLVSQQLTGAESQDFAVSAKVFDPAHRVLGRIQPKPARNLPVAAVLGIMLGLVTAFVREQFDDTVRTIGAAEEAFGQTASASLPPGLLGFQPFDRTQGKRADPVLTELALQRLRASVTWAPDPAESRTLVVTSANPEEGKTTIAANLAVLMVTEGRSVILVDADLRHPSLFKYLSMPVPGGKDLEAVMSGAARLSEALVEIPVGANAFASADTGPAASWANVRTGARASGRLRAILASPERTTSSEFSLARAAELFDELKGQADFVIFDGPPILVVPDIYPFVATADTVIAVVRLGASTARSTKDLERSLERLRPRRIELVVTDAEPSFAQTNYYGHRPAAPELGNRKLSS